MTARDCAVIVPSNRSVSADRLRHIPQDIPVFVVNDGDAPIAATRRGMQVFDRAFRRKVMGPDLDLIPTRTSACRNFGFYYAWKYTDCRYVISLDDDVQTQPGFLDAYGVLGEIRTLPTVEGVRWFNTLDLFDDMDGLFPRGYPFDEREADPPRWSQTTALVVSHMGLWDTVLDTHAIDKLLFAEYRAPRPRLHLRQPLVRVGSGATVVHFPFCSMNFGFVREVLPLMFQAAMVDSFADRYSLGRYEDIWAGYIAQRLVARRGDAMTVGAPIVQHAKDGDLQRELRGEHYGLLLSPYLYAVVDAVCQDVRAAPYLDMIASFAEHALTRGAALRRELRVPPLYWSYIEALFSTIQRWAALCG